MEKTGIKIFLLVILFIFNISWARLEPDSLPNHDHIPFLGFPYKDKVIVLVYHQIDPKIQGPISISPSLFKSHMIYLKEMGFHPISSYVFERFLEGKGEVPENAVLITFDDGYESFYKYAYPVLKELKFPAINFVIVSRIGTNGHLTWEEMEEMQKSGLITFGSHTYDSHYYALRDKWGHKSPALITHIYDPKTGHKEDDEEYRNRVRIDLQLSKILLEENLNTHVESLCFPYGAYNSEVIKIAEELGFRYFYTTIKGIDKEEFKDPYIVKRIPVGSYNMSVSKLNLKILQTAFYNENIWGIIKIYITSLSQRVSEFFGKQEKVQPSFPPLRKTHTIKKKP